MQRPDKAGVLHPTVVDKSHPQATTPANIEATRPIPLAQAVETVVIPETSRPFLSAADGRRRDGGSFHGNACAFGSPFLWLPSFGEAKESSPPPRGKRQIKNIRAADTPDKNKIGRKAMTACSQPFQFNRGITLGFAGLAQPTVLHFHAYFFKFLSKDAATR
ncbi:hypothetical protein [Vogesella indigofera]|uniref:hypothetical protein n=1 Tax=Vogesella indigofera TaxID=45465 RepID=UPI00234F1CD7|nr:hypothetical protein [Vogesella indigofera]MDC7709292.1 hypothetical protein [Vogesella indigofera]